MNITIQAEIDNALNNSPSNNLRQLLLNIFKHDAVTYDIDKFIEKVETMDYEDINQLCYNIIPQQLGDITCFHSLLTAALNFEHK